MSYLPDKKKPQTENGKKQLEKGLNLKDNLAQMGMEKVKT